MLTFDQMIKREERLESLMKYVYYTYGESILDESIEYFDTSLKLNVYHGYSYFLDQAKRYNYLGIDYPQRLIYLHDELREQLHFVLYDTKNFGEVFKYP